MIHINITHVCRVLASSGPGQTPALPPSVVLQAITAGNEVGRPASYPARHNYPSTSVRKIVCGRNPRKSYPPRRRPTVTVSGNVKIIW